jgi:hypothetical protein
LGFTIDEIIGTQNRDRIFFDIKADTSTEPEKSFLAMIKDYYDYIDAISRASDTEALVSINRISIFFLIRYDTLFKFFYYKWIHQTYNVPVYSPFSETTIPPEVALVRKQLRTRTEATHHASFILNRDIFLAIVREIQYYYNRRLISEEEMGLLKEELLELLLYVEKIMQKGVNDSGCIQNFYISLLDIETNSSCATYEGNIISQFWMYSVSSVIIKNQEICVMHKKWLESLKKCSVLITQSNEILQEEFIKKQREFIEGITNELSYYYDE